MKWMEINICSLDHYRVASGWVTIFFWSKTAYLWGFFVNASWEREKKRTTCVDANFPKCTTEWMSIDIQRMHVKNANLAKRNIFNLMFCSYWFRFLFLSRMFSHRFFGRFVEWQMMHAVFAAIFSTGSVDLNLILHLFFFDLFVRKKNHLWLYSQRPNSSSHRYDGCMRKLNMEISDGNLI